MDLTVCICTHDRPAYVRDCLNGLRQQTVRRDRFAVLLVDSASSPHAAAELANLAAQHDARLIRLDRPGGQPGAQCRRLGRPDPLHCLY